MTHFALIPANMVSSSLIHTFLLYSFLLDYGHSCFCCDVTWHVSFWCFKLNMILPCFVPDVCSTHLLLLYCICSEENLRAALNKMGIGGHALEEIMDKVKNRHYQVLYFIAIGLTEQYDIPELTGLSGIMKYTASLHINLWDHTRCLLWFWNQPSKSIFQWKPESSASQSECSSLIYTWPFSLCSAGFINMS